MLFVPIAIGILLGAVVFLSTKSLINKQKTKTSIYTPSILAFVVSFLFVLIGLVFVRGFEGAAYLFVAIPLVISASLSFFYAMKKSTSS